MGHGHTADRHVSAADGFTRLLARLGHDTDEAAAQYGHLRAALEKFFDTHGAWPPDECADETLDRLARKLESEMPIDEVRSYARGIARLVLLEWQRRPVEVPVDTYDFPDRSAARTDEKDERFRACFDRCLATLSTDSRTLVLEYYVNERRAKIDNRRRLARQFGLSQNALRSRVQRVRDRLERCVQSCTCACRREWP